MLNEDKPQLRKIINYLNRTKEHEWCEDVVRSKDGQRNCMFGHLFAMGKDEKESNDLWNWFESAVATEYRIYPINDGKDPDYQQSTPKQRCVAFLEDVYNNRQESTME